MAIIGSFYMFTNIESLCRFTITRSLGRISIVRSLNTFNNHWILTQIYTHRMDTNTDLHS
jgi:hypothetical protein